MGIIGYGHTGEAVSRALTSLGMRVLAYDKYRFGYGGEWAVETDMETIRKEADVVSLHLPLTAETIGLVDDAWLEAFTKSVWLINTSRGAITPLEPLIRQLESGRLRGLALDVLPKEPLKNYSLEEQQALNKLYTFEQVVLTPHIAGYTQESPERMARVLLDKLGAGLGG